MSAITIPKGPINLAGLLYRSPTKAKTPALIIVHPGGCVKEQAPHLYASELSLAGFTVICYDASHQGESGGEPRFLEDPIARVSDIWAVVDYVEELDTVDPSRIGVIGICAGGGYAVAAAKEDHRIKTVTALSMVNFGDALHQGWNGDEDPSKHAQTLQHITTQIMAENTHAEPAIIQYVPSDPDENTPNDLKEAGNYFFTPRGQHPRSENKMLLRSVPLISNFDAFYLADLFLTQPTLLIAGDRAGSLWHTEKLNDLLDGRSKTIYMPGAKHIDLFDEDHYVMPAIKQILLFLEAEMA